MATKLKTLSKETFTNLTQNNWYIKPLGSYELCVQGPKPVDNNTRRKTKTYGDVLNVRCTKVGKNNQIPIIQILTGKGWLHLDPLKYEKGLCSDITIGQMMSKPLSKSHPVNSKMGKIVLAHL